MSYHNPSFKPKLSLYNGGLFHVEMFQLKGAVEEASHHGRSFSSFLSASIEKSHKTATTNYIVKQEEMANNVCDLDAPH
jgi:hypothetical protein